MPKIPESVSEVFGFSKTATANLKGLAILVMLAHHLYGMYSVRIAEGLSYSAEVVEWARYGKVCVFLFLFVTGYGYCCIAEKDKSRIFEAGWRRSRRFYPIYLAMLAIAVLLFTYGGHFDGDVMREFPKNWVGYLCAAIGIAYLPWDYWFMGAFLMGALVMYPLLLWGVRRGPIWETLVFLGLAATIVFADKFNTNVMPHVYSGVSSLLSNRMAGLVSRNAWCEALPWMAGILTGWACASVRLRRGVGDLALLTLSLFIYWWWRPMYLLPMLVVLLLAKLSERWRMGSVVLGWLGALSGVMWLNHRLIFGYWFADFFYSIPAPWNYLLLVVLSAAAAQVFMWVYGGAAHILASFGARRRESGVSRPWE